MLLITEFMDGGDLFKAISRKQVSWTLRCGASPALPIPTFHPLPGATPAQPLWWLH